MMEFKVISVRQPWAWLIVNGYKDIENRTWRRDYRGKLLIQAGARSPTRQELEDLRQDRRLRGIKLPEKFETGGIVGLAKLDDCAPTSRSKWWSPGQIAWKLSEARTLRFIPLKGTLRLFDPPAAVRRRVMQQLGREKKER
jgi:hypothetical protein